jgi:uroporphyrinogen-III synthase
MAHRLDRRTVVVTRGGKAGDDGLVQRLEALGAAVRSLPSIAFAPPADLAPLDAALVSLGGFDWAVFTSTTAVDRTLARLDALGLSREALASLSLAAVGPATAARLAVMLRPPDLVPADAKGDAMAAALGELVRGRRVLFPRPAEGRPETVEGLLRAGAELVAVDAYRTVPAPPETLRPLAGWIEAREVDAVAFASPSAVKAVVDALGAQAKLLARVLLAAIGPTTADALREAGFAPGAQPARYTGEALADAVADALGTG